jgi:hypothetical protein
MNQVIIMIARVSVHIPFDILLAIDEQFPIYTFQYPGFKVSIYPPGRDPTFSPQQEPSSITLNGKKAVLCNVFRMDFQKNEFNREINQDPTKITIDPPLVLINGVLNDFLMRIRHLTKANQIHLLNLSSCRWWIEYLNDDGSELISEKGKFKGRARFKFDFKYVALNQEIWEDIFTLPLDFRSEYWNDLLLDGTDELPEIGPSIVLTFTALEIFIAKILNQLATKEKISPEFWAWINQRPDWAQEPTVEEQYDDLLTILCGHSLKEDEKLWTAFKNLKSARNNFVHEGVAKISKKTSQKPLEENEARELIAHANKIPIRIREWLPKEIQWDLSKNYNIKFDATWPLIGPQEKNEV